MNINLKKLVVGAVAASALGSVNALPVLADAAGVHQASELWLFGLSVPSAFDNVYTFTIGPTDLLAVAVSNESDPFFNILGGKVELYSNTGNTDNSPVSFLDDSLAYVGSSFLFDSGPGNSAVFTNLAGGDYYYRVTGTIVGTVGGSYLLSSAIVPEPGTYALLLAGLGVMGFVAKRRRVV